MEIVNDINNKIDTYKKIINKFEVFLKDVIFITLFGIDYE